MKVLIVDDEPDIRMLLSAMLKRKGFMTITAENLTTAKEKIHQGTADLAILDLNLPDGIGFELIPIIKEKWEGETKIIINSAHDGAMERKTAEEEGADHFIAKPLSTSKLNAALEAVGMDGLIS